MKSEIHQTRQLRFIQSLQIAIIALTPVPLIAFLNYMKYPAREPFEFFHGLGQFLGATLAELALAIASLFLLIKVYRMGPRWGQDGAPNQGNPFIGRVGFPFSFCTWRT